MSQSLGHGISSGGLNTGGNFRIRWYFSDNWQISCDFLGGFEKKHIFAAEVLNIEGIDYEKYE